MKKDFGDLVAEAAKFRRNRQLRVKTHGSWPTREEAARRLANVEVVYVRRKDKKKTK